MRAPHNGRRNTRPLTTHHSPLTRRDGFTLVELLVVIAIIGVLIALLLPAIMKIRERGTEVQMRHEITQMQTSVQGFTSKNQIDFIPSQIILREDGAWGSNPNPQLQALELQSLAYLKRLWPRLATVASPNFAGHDWNGDGQITLGSNPDQGWYKLEGDQCLVFFLGGIQVGGASQGFGVNKQYPANINQSLTVWSKNEAPVMDFPTDRLGVSADPFGTGRSQQFRSFLDPWGSPYAYFSSRGGFGGSANQYNPDCSGLLGVNGDGSAKGIVNGGRPSFYCEGRAGQGVVKPANRDGFQIICAGKEKVFATPFQSETFVCWNPATGQRSHDLEQPGVPAGSGGKPAYADVGPREAHTNNYSNFHPMALGNGTQ